MADSFDCREPGHYPVSAATLVAGTSVADADAVVKPAAHSDQIGPGNVDAEHRRHLEGPRFDMS